MLKSLMIQLKCNYKVTNTQLGNKIVFNKQYSLLRVVYTDRILKDYTIKRLLDLGYYAEYNPVHL